ncbi:transcriptional regulator, GntR family [Gluconacetobacter diazotrophicus PA1 5]|uniref:GntR family transcriptional regulator n=2 Tax=Gluconacetobacter diazotrophicus TaxID=33996 RepID=A0A7W4I8H9_GLUDI|nr:GntR family transcriptional regulator [Gluconacetobacter diazotrophicus]ACI50689.1 transcriptional regulator, GntR family [Gluconacetobacter diazotrophicus PA1 5]MBB2158152.1 GntR family transcriptional regulator [Gluconacetobacter diazotrophicus]TWA99901.1 GntR family transcriptional regulator [Gluconacetobacter diazotrophicus]
MVPSPLYQQIAERLRQEIDASKPGTKLASEPALANAWGVSRFTVSRAVEALVDEGLVVRRQGAGTFVADRPLRRTPGMLLSFTEAVKAAGRVATHRLCAFEKWPGNGVPPFESDGPVTVMDRLRYVDGVPIARHHSVVPEELVTATGLTRQIAAREDFSFYRFLATHGYPVASASERLSGRLATPDEQVLLGLNDPAVLIVVHRQSFDASGRLLDMVEAVYDARHYYYESRLIRNATADREPVNDKTDASSTVDGGPGLDFGRGRLAGRKLSGKKR